MSRQSGKIRQLVDWRAALWAAVVSGIVFFMLNLFLSPLIIGGNTLIMIRFMAALVLGDEVLPPPADFEMSVFMAAVGTNFLLTLIFGILVAYVIHRGGLVVGIIGGAVLGLALYGINFYVFTYFFPWLFPFRGWVSAFNHIILGSAAGGIYEWLEVERFVPVSHESRKRSP
jgi:hypothetical protein